MIITSGSNLKFEGEIIVSHTYLVTLKNGQLVQDQTTAALRAAGYEIVKIESSSSGQDAG